MLKTVVFIFTFYSTSGKSGLSWWRYSWLHSWLSPSCTVCTHSDILTLILALQANTVLFWLLIKNRKWLSLSDVLGLNRAVLSVLFCLNLPLDIKISTKDRSPTLLRISHTFATLSHFGCSLLMTRIGVIVKMFWSADEQLLQSIKDECTSYVLIATKYVLAWNCGYGTPCAFHEAEEVSSCMLCHHLVLPTVYHGSSHLCLHPLQHSNHFSHHC